MLETSENIKDKPCNSISIFCPTELHSTLSRFRLTTVSTACWACSSNATVWRSGRHSMNRQGQAFKKRPNLRFLSKRRINWNFVLTAFASCIAGRKKWKESAVRKQMMKRTVRLSNKRRRVSHFPFILWRKSTKNITMISRLLQMFWHARSSHIKRLSLSLWKEKPFFFPSLELTKALNNDTSGA